MSDEFQDQLEGLLDELKGSADDFIFRRINHIGFAKVIFFIGVKGRKEDFLYVKDLAEFRKITRQGASYILGDLANVGLLKKVCKVDNLAEFWICRDEYGVPKVNKYFKVACNTLGIKHKLVVDDLKISERLKR